MLDNSEEKKLLLTANEDEEQEEQQSIRTTPSMLVDHIPLRTRPPPVSTHCHRAEKPLDYAARNRLVVVLILCLIFMIIEIVGRRTRRGSEDTRSSLFSRWNRVQLDRDHHRCRAHVHRRDRFSHLVNRDVLGEKTSHAELVLRFYSRRSARRLAQRPHRLVDHRHSRLHGDRPLYRPEFRRQTVGNDRRRLVRRDFQHHVGAPTSPTSGTKSFRFLFSMFFVLHAVPHHGHSHHSHHSHSEASLVVDVDSGHSHPCATSTNQNINIRAAVIHVIGDFCQSIGVLLAAILIKVKVKKHFLLELELQLGFSGS